MSHNIVTSLAIGSMLIVSEETAISFAWMNRFIDLTLKGSSMHR